MAAKGVVGWLLPEAERAKLLARFPPAYPDLIAHHATLWSGVSESHERPRAREGRVVGLADDGRGVQALVVEIDGTTDRPDGSTYHITWSLDKKAGRKAKESNDVIAAQGWRAVAPIPVALEPAFFRWSEL